MRDLTGLRVNRLTVIRPTNERRNKSVVWEVVCDCGKHTKVAASNLTSKRPTQSCGCYHIDNVKNRSTIHGMRNTPEYAVWRTMKARCLNPKHKSFKNYGARGITIQKDWINDFSQFLSDVGRRPSSEHTLERIDNNEGYTKSNCTWKTLKEQARNRRSTVFWRLGDDTFCIAEWAEKLGILPETLHTRVNRLGWSIEKALTTPVRKHRNG